MSATDTESATRSADLSNWRTAPFNRWAFHNVRDIVRTQDIARNPQDLWALPAAPRSLDAFALRLGEGKILSLEQFLEATASDGLVILHDGRLVFEDYRNGTTQSTPHIVMSATKSVVGLIAGILAAQGRLHLDGLVTDTVPELAGTPYSGATLRDLLDMRGGFIPNEAQLRAYSAATGWEPKNGAEPGAGLHAFLGQLKGPAVQHGGAFRYISANTDLLGWVLERATGERFAQLVSRLLWKPLGAEGDAYITEDGFGAPRTTGGLCATVRDFARLGQLIVQDGRRDGSEIIPHDLIVDIEEGGDRDAWAKGEFAAGFSGVTMRYRSGWYVVDDAPKMIFAMGIHGQNLFVDRGNRLVIAKVSSQANALDYRAIGLTHRAVAEFRRCLLAA